MATQARNLKVVLTGESASAVRAFNEVSTAADKASSKSTAAFDKSTTKIGGSFKALDRQLATFGVPFAGALTLMGSNLDKASAKTSTFHDKLSTLGGGVALGAAAGIALIGTASVKAALDGEKAQARLDVAIKNTGSNVGDFGGKIDNLVGHMADFGFANDDVENSLSRLIPATHDVGKAIQLMSLAADIAKARNIDLQSATDLLTKVEQGRFTQLQRLGLASSAQIKSFHDAADAVDFLTGKYKGSAQAAADTYAGKLAALQAKAHNLEEEIGGKLLPVISDTVGVVLKGADAFDTANSATDGWAGKLALSAAAIPVLFFAYDKLTAGLSILGASYGRAAEAVGLKVAAEETDTVATGESAAANATLATSNEAVATSAGAAGTGIGVAGRSALGATASFIGLGAAAIGAYEGLQKAGDALRSSIGGGGGGGFPGGFLGGVFAKGVSGSSSFTPPANSGDLSKIGQSFGRSGTLSAQDAATAAHALGLSIEVTTKALIAYRDAEIAGKGATSAFVDSLYQQTGGAHQNKDAFAVLGNAISTTDSGQQNLAGSTKTATGALAQQVPLTKEQTKNLKDQSAALTDLGKVAGPSAQRIVAAAHLPADAIKGLTTELDAVGQSADKAFDTAGNAISDFSGKAKVSFHDFIAEQFKQLVATQNWASNLSKLADLGLNQGYLKKLEDAGPKAAGIVQTLLDNVKNGSISSLNAITDAGAKQSANFKGHLDQAVLNTNAAVFKISNYLSHIPKDIPVNIQIGVQTPGPRALGTITETVNGVSVATPVFFRPYARGGKVNADSRFQLVGEEGPELVQLPTGSTVFNASETAQVKANAIGVSFSSGTNSVAASVDAGTQALDSFVSTAVSQLPDASTAITNFAGKFQNDLGKVRDSIQNTKQAQADYDAALKNTALTGAEKLHDIAQKHDALLQAQRQESVAKATLKKDFDPASFTAQVIGETSAIKLFGAELETLIKWHDTDLARALASVGPTDGHILAEGFAKDKGKADAAERAIDARTKQEGDYTNILKQLGITPKAAGGSVQSGGLYLVGEKRPELFRPSTAGQIIPNPALGSKQLTSTTTGNVTFVINAAGIPQRELGRSIVKALQEHVKVNGPIRDVELVA